jgi:hypothetical protein
LAQGLHLPERRKKRKNSHCSTVKGVVVVKDFRLNGLQHIHSNDKLSVSKTLKCNMLVEDAIRLITAKGTHRLVRLTIDKHTHKAFSVVNPKELVYEVSCIDGYLYTQQNL